MNNILRIIISIFMAFCAAGMPLQAATGTRHALVIGISDYAQFKPALKNPSKDVELVVPKFVNSGFKVTVVKPSETDRDGILRAFSQFLGNIRQGDEVIVYYTGHGVSLDSENYIVPSNAPDPKSVAGAKLLGANLISINDLIAQIASIPDVVQFWIVDACRTNPYKMPDRGYTPDQGLEKIEGLTGDVVVFSSAQENATANDELRSDPPGAKLGSPFARAFVAAYDQTKSKHIDDFMRLVTGNVIALVSPHIQRPDRAGSITGMWCLDDCDPESKTAVLDRQLARVQDQLNKLYRPLNTALSKSDSEWVSFGDRLFSGYGVYYPLDGNGRPVATTAASSETMWGFWINEVRSRFKPNNDAIASLINSNPSLAEDQDTSKCFHEFLVHKTAFDDSLARIDADPGLRVWNITRPWPECIIPRVREAVEQLVERESKLATSNRDLD